MYIFYVLCSFSRARCRRPYIYTTINFSLTVLRDARRTIRAHSAESTQLYSCTSSEMLFTSEALACARAVTLPRCTLASVGHKRERARV